MFQLLKNKKISISGMVLIMVVGLFFLASSGFSDDSSIKVKEIKMPPTLDTPVMLQETPNEPHYFAKGTVDAIGDKWITINDHQFIIAPDARLSCNVGDFVGIQVDDQVNVVMCEKIIK